MADIDTRIADLLGSILGCAFLVMIKESGLSQDDVASRSHSLRLAASSADCVDIFGGGYEAIATGVMEKGKSMEAQARALIEYPKTAWWFKPVDLGRQAWLSVHGTPDKYIYGTPPNTDMWVQPQNPSARWERYAQRPYRNQRTSTLYGSRLSSLAIAYDERVGDHYCEFPLAWWAMRFPESVRVFEIQGPADWHRLCSKYPARGAKDDRLVPNWGAISEEWDGVHLSMGGLLTAEQNRYESSAGGILAGRADLLAAKPRSRIHSPAGLQPHSPRGTRRLHFPRLP